MEIESIDQVQDKYAITFVDENVNPIMTIYITEKDKIMIANAMPLTINF